MMLQKTDAKKAISIYPLIIQHYPTPQDLSRADLRVLKKQIRLLGINDRARRMKQTAKTILRLYMGKVPQDRNQLRSLLGVGDYISNAVLCFAFKEDVPLLDANVIRVMERVFSITSSRSRPRNDKKLWEFAGLLVPQKRAVDYNRGILDFAALVCTARNPKCGICPNQRICDFYSSGNSSTTNDAKTSGSILFSITSPNLARCFFMPFLRNSFNS